MGSSKSVPTWQVSPRQRGGGGGGCGAGGGGGGVRLQWRGVVVEVAECHDKHTDTRQTHSTATHR